SVNLTGPAPVTNAEFTRAVGRALHRPAPWWVPGIALKAVLGQAGEEMALDGPLPVQGHLLPGLAEHGLERDPRNPPRRGPVQRPADSAGELGVGHRLGAGQVQRAGDVVRQDVDDRADLVLEGDPRH